MKIPLRLTRRLSRIDLQLSATVQLALLFVFVAACRPAANLPSKDSEKYREVVRAFYVGLSALQVGDDVRAEASLTRATELVPEEPASWADLGLLNLRQKNFDLASERLAKAQTLAPENSQIQVLLGLMESERGRTAESIAYLRKAVELEQKNLRARYLLAEQVERQAAEGSEAEAQRLMEQITEAQPDNLAALVEVARLSAKRGDGATLQRVIARLEQRAPSWPAEVQEQFKALQAAAAGTDSRAAATRIAFLRNVLVRVPEYRKGLSSIKSPPGEEAEPITGFLRLPTPDFTHAPPDEALSFTSEPLPDFGTAKWDWAGAIAFSGDAAPVVVTARAGELKIAGGATIKLPESNVVVAPHGILAMDFNYDFKTDLVYAGAGGVRLYRQDNLNSFVDVTAQTTLPASITSALCTGAWAADIEADGDLDIVVGVENGPTLVLRNNGDGTFKELRPFEGTTSLHKFIWADLDNDGDADAALLSPPSLQVYANERAGQFRPRTMPTNLLPVRTISVGDINSDGTLDLLALQGNATIVRISDKNEGQDWDVAEIARLPTNYIHGVSELFAADLDNNGGLDLALSLFNPATGAQCPPFCPALTYIWLGDQKANFKPLETQPVSRTFAVADLNGDGRLDLTGLSADGQAVRLNSRGSKNYHWQIIRPRARQAVGDQRINSFGIGGEMEIRSGLLTQKQLITSPIVHFGLGEQAGADVVRIVWPNGSVRAEFDLKADQEVVAEQRLKGSCPFLFAYDGEKMNFVKDCQPWGAAIGLHIDTLDPKGALSTEEWFKIDGDQLAVKDGAYDLRITAELWETYYYDHLSLMVVDHPVGTDIFVDERFSIPSPELSVRTVEKPRELARAVDDRGQDVSEILRTRDGRHLDTFGRGKYQGLTRDHYVEVELGQDANADGPLWLIATGWLHPTDASINVAIQQGGHEQPRDLSLEVPDGRGGWVEKKSHQGFPAGRNKTALFDLSGIFLPGTPRRVRLRTNLEIYWDAIWWAKGIPGAENKTQRLSPDVAELRYRGHSLITQADESSPETPDYNRMAGTVQRWRDLVGYYTRFGDVRELLERVDDRYVIMNSGDEMAFKFAAPGAPAPGFVRDFVLIGDGWIKDGDYNSTFSKTVLPLPAHDIHDYTTVASRLEDDPVYRRHPEDWQRYHTRYVTPDGFHNALRTK